MKLVIAEKPSVGVSIAKVLGASSKKDGYYEGGGYVVSWCIGHLVGLADADKYDEAYKKWELTHLPIIPQEWQFEISSKTQNQFYILKQLMIRSDITEVICATDAGREGELIFRLVYNKAGCNKPIKRLWISSMEESAIVQGLNSLKHGGEYDTLYDAALCRSKADWLVGINATRLYSVTYGGVLNIGRVITPTLAMVASRNEKITKFQKERYYIARLSLGGYETLSEHIQDLAIAERLKSLCSGKSAVCTTVRKEKKTAAPPKLFDLTSLQREANRLFGYTAQETLDTAQKLYEAKRITYPRTDSNYLTSDMERSLPELVYIALMGVGGSPAFNFKQVINDSKVTDHHAIIITKGAMIGFDEMPKKERDILRLICNRIVCAVSDKHIYESVAAEFDCEGYKFTAKGKKILQEGWKARSIKAEEDKKDGEEKALPEIAEGSSHSVWSTRVTEHETQPPKHYTENTLLSAMENAGKEEMTDDAERKGIGTPATRAGIIETLIKRQFVERRGKQLIPTSTGISLISVVPDMLKSPVLTAEWENKLAQMVKGNVSPCSFMGEIETFVMGVVKNAPAADKPVFAKKAVKVGDCRKCGESVVDTPKAYSCAKKCGFIVWKENAFLRAAKKTLTKAMVEKLLEKGSIKATGLTSKAGKQYDCTLSIDDSGKVSPVFN